MPPLPADTRSSPAPHPPEAAGGEREFRFDRNHFNFIAGLIYELAGIHLAPHKMEMMYSRLARRVRALRLQDFDDYCALLEGEGGADEIGYLVNAMTTNLTAFFRESHHFEHLEQTTLPWVRGRQGGSAGGAGGRSRLRIWSAGCSSGQEPYTISMVVAATLADVARWDARVLATDIDTHMVEVARRGLYPQSLVKSIPPEWRDWFARRSSVVEGEPMVEMADELKRLIAFKPLNLIERWPMKGPFDAIFCRNVLIYFDRNGRKEIIDKFAALLAPEGFLYLGHSESLYGLSTAFQQAGSTIYRRLP